MSLVWHMVRKDLRRLRLPLILWLALVLARTGLLLAAGGKPEDPPNPVAYQGLGYFASTWGFIVAAVGFVLAAWLVMEDSLVDTRAFWPTRPISPARLFATKILGALLMFSVGPVLVLTPVWLGCGFSWSELALAAWHQAALQAVLSAAAFVLAGLTATAGQFLVRAMVAATVGPLSVAFAQRRFFPSELPVSAGLIGSRDEVVLGLLVVTLLVVLGHQHLTRRTFRSWVLGGVGLGLMLAVGRAWSWDISPLLHPNPAGAADQAEVGGIGVGHPQLDLSPSPKQDPDAATQFRLQGAVTGVPAQSYVRFNASLGQWSNGTERVAFNRALRAPAGSARPPESLVRQIAGLPAPGPVPTEWTITADEPDERVGQARAGSRKLEVTFNLTLMRGRVLGELPLRVGAELHAGASRTRIRALERTEAGLAVRLEDRAAQPESPFESIVARLARGPRQPEDVFLLVHRSTGLAEVPVGREIGTVWVSSILVGERELTLIPPTRELNGQTVEIPGWEDDAVLIQVRFLPEVTFSRFATLDPFTTPPGR